jgi:hypothetical protein
MLPMCQVTILLLEELSVNDLMLHSGLERCVWSLRGRGMRVSDPRIRSYMACVQSSIKWGASGY